MPFKNKEDLYASQQKHRDRNSDNLWQILIKSECHDCGINDPRVLEFDHLPQFKKSFGIGRAVGGSTRSWNSILKEIEKCEIVCANCHRIRTLERGSHKKSRLHNSAEE